MKYRPLLLVLTFVISLSNADAQDLRSMPDEDLYPFYHGVASGDPLDDGVIIWTRVSPDQVKESVVVNWRLALDTGMTDIVSTGEFETNATRDYTVKVDVAGLSPGTWYYYDFEALGNYSIRGRTRTLPSGDVDQMRFAVASCSNYEHGYFNAYKHIAIRNDLQAVIHLGDYQYEYQVGGYSSFIEGRQNEPEGETITLEDYRIRHSHYKLDEDLRAAHQQYPWFTVWDDHEFANNAWTDGAQNHNEGEGLWADREAFAKQAYFEWMPVRDDEDQLIRRHVDFGDLMRVYFLDTRIEGRDEQVGVGSDEVSSPDRTLLGEEQKDWLENQMNESEIKWNVLAQQVMVAPLEAFGLELNTDQWDGYQADRDWLYGLVQGIALSNFVVLTGDIHTSWANNLPLSNYNENTQTGSVGVEFVCTSVTSTALPIDLGEGLVQFLNPHVEYVDLQQHGYILLDVNEQRMQADWMYVDEVLNSQYGQSVGASYEVLCDEHFVESADFAISGDENTVPLAPLDPMSGDVGTSDLAPFNIISAYPNPSQSEVTIQFGCFNASDLQFEMYDSHGRLLNSFDMGLMSLGLHYAVVPMKELSPGMYVLRLRSGNVSTSVSILKH